jgi:DNA-binding transcriptional LysR family regulator
MLTFARAVIADTARATTAALRASGVKAGELHVAALYSISLGIFPAVLRIWRRANPDIRIRLFEYKHVVELAAAMEAGQADVAIGPPSPDWAGPIQEIGAEEFVIVTATDDPIAARTARDIDLADLADRDWVHFTKESGLSHIFDHACAAAGFTPRIAVRTEQGPSAAQLAAAGLGPTLVSGNIVPPNFDGHLLRPNPPVLRPLSAFTRDTPDPITAAFIKTTATDTLVTPSHIRRRICPA